MKRSLQSYLDDIASIEWGTLWLTGLILATVGTAALLIVDCSAGHRVPYIGIVTGHDYQPPYTTYSSHCMAHNSKGACTSTVMTPEYHSAQWYLEITTRAKVFYPPVGETTYNDTRDGDSVRVSCRNGRWTGWCYGAQYEGRK